MQNQAKDRDYSCVIVFVRLHLGSLAIKYHILPKYKGQHVPFLAANEQLYIYKCILICQIMLQVLG